MLYADVCVSSATDYIMFAIKCDKMMTCFSQYPRWGKRCWKTSKKQPDVFSNTHTSPNHMDWRWVLGVEHSDL